MIAQFFYDDSALFLITILTSVVYLGDSLGRIIYAIDYPIVSQQCFWIG